MQKRHLTPLRARRTQTASSAVAARRPAVPAAAVKQHAIWQPRQHRRATSALLATGDGSADKGYAADELSEYEELLRQKKEAKQQALKSAIRQRKQKVSQQQQQQQQTTHSATTGSPAPAASSSSGAAAAATPPASPAAAAASQSRVPAAPSGARFAARPRSIPFTLQQRQQQQQQRPLPPQHQQHLSDSPTSTAPPSPAGGADSTAADADLAETATVSTEGLPSDDVLQSMLNELLEGEDDNVTSEGDEEESDNVTTGLNTGVTRSAAAAAGVGIKRRKTPAEIRAAAIARRASRRQLIQQQLRRDAAASSSSSSSRKAAELVAVPKYNDSNLSKLAANDPQAAALQQMLAAAAAEDDQSSEGGATDNTQNDTENNTDAVDDLDWEALGQYEQVEQYLHDLQKQQRLPARSTAAAAAAAAPPAALTAPASSSSSSSGKPQIPKPQTPAAAAGPQKLKRVPAGTSARKFEKDLDELEQFIYLFEAVETAKAGSSTSSSSSTLQPPQQQQQQQAADAGEALVAALLGRDWESELLDDLASVIDEDDDQAAAAGGSSSGQQQQQDRSDLAAEEDDQPWADEVTNLLLGLVTASHKRYLKSDLPLPDLENVTEDNRCSAFWTAPWALLVTDDSGQYNMEYVNESACQMLGGSYLGLFGQPAFQQVDSGLEAQTDWAYAVQRVEVSGVNCARISQLTMKDVSGQPVIARDVCMWRVDSLEDTPIGMAVLVKSWQR